MVWGGSSRPAGLNSSTHPICLVGFENQKETIEGSIGPGESWPVGGPAGGPLRGVHHQEELAEEPRVRSHRPTEQENRNGEHARAKNPMKNGPGKINFTETSKHDN